MAKGRRRDSKKAFFNGKEGRDDFRKTPSLTVRKDGVILEKRYCNEEPNITFFKTLIGVTTCNIVVTL